MWDGLRATQFTIDIRRGDANDPLGGVVRIEQAAQRPVDLILGRFAWHHRTVTRAQPMPDGPPVVLARDLVLLKLYAGGPQDLWDIQELLRQPGSDSLIADVAADLADQPPAMQQVWQAVRK